MKGTFLWVTDPWDTLDLKKDTTLRWMQESVKADIQQFWCNAKTIRIERNRVCLDAFPVLRLKHTRTAQFAFQFGKKVVATPNEFSKIIYRPDPPVDSAYLFPLQLLHLGVTSPHSKRPPAEMINPFHVLFSQNEKLIGAAFKVRLPRFVVSSQPDVIEAFGKATQSCVLKPLNEAMSHGVERLQFRSPSEKVRARKLIRLATQEYRQPVLIQDYLPGIKKGEVRLWFLDGSLIACAKKLPLHGDFRVNIDQGSRVVPAEIGSKEKSTLTEISRCLNHYRIRLAAVDLIDALVTDFNFTSPGLIVEMEEVLGENLSSRIVNVLARR